MKTLKSILIFSLCILSFNSCKTDNDLGGDPDVPTDKVALSKYGMKAYFPKTGWGNQITESYNSHGYEMNCITAYLKDSRIEINGEINYFVSIYFMRFVSTFANKTEADEMVELIQYIYDGMPDYTLVSIDIPAQISTYNNASKMVYKTTSGSIEESYYIYKNNRLYRIIIVMPEDKVSIYRAECMEIINTLQITD